MGRQKRRKSHINEANQRAMEMPINWCSCEEWRLPCNGCTRAISVWKLKRKLSGCASNLLAHEDLGNFEEAHHWNIQAKFYNEKFPLVYESDTIGNSLSWRSCCYFEAQVWKKDSSIAPSLLFSHFSILFGPFVPFLWPLFFLFFVQILIPTCGGIIVSIILSSHGTML